MVVSYLRSLYMMHVQKSIELSVRKIEMES